MTRNPSPCLRNQPSNLSLRSQAPATPSPAPATSPPSLFDGYRTAQLTSPDPTIADISNSLSNLTHASPAPAISTQISLADLNARLSEQRDAVMKALKGPEGDNLAQIVRDKLAGLGSAAKVTYRVAAHAMPQIADAAGEAARVMNTARAQHTQDIVFGRPSDLGQGSSPGPADAMSGQGFLDAQAKAQRSWPSDWASSDEIEGWSSGDMVPIPELVAKKEEEMRERSKKVEEARESKSMGTATHGREMIQRSETRGERAKVLAPEEYTKPFTDFLTQNPTVFHAVDYFGKKLTDAGFQKVRLEWCCVPSPVS